jgi:3-oxoacyl-[acyl-carrier-protein] synthase-1
MSVQGICITGLGMITSLGHDVATSCAAARAALTRSRELKVLNSFCDQEPEPVMGHAVPLIAEGFVGLAKASMLGSYALKDLLARRPILANECDRTGIYINLSDQFILDACAERPQMDGDETDEDSMEAWSLPSSAWAAECSNLIPRLLTHCAIPIPPANHRLYFSCHTGVITAIQDAIEQIASGIFDRCIVGGIDCCIEPRFLAVAIEMGFVKTSVTPAGFMPGEAAGFLLIERLERAQSRGVEIKSLIASAATGKDEIHRLSEESPRGVTLAETIERLFSRAPRPAQKVSLIIGDLNGDNFRAIDWGYALIRLQEQYKLGDLPIWLPALGFGETGAATGALAICMATRGFQRRYAPDGTILIWLSSDNGSKAAILLEPMPY